MSEQIQEMLKRAQATQVPIDAVDADSLPREQALQYDEICRMIGHLYIDHHHQMRILQERHQAIVGSLEDRIKELLYRNQEPNSASSTSD